MNKLSVSVLCVRCLCGEQWWMGDTKEISCTCGIHLIQNSIGGVFASVPDDLNISNMPFKEPIYWEEPIEINEEETEHDHTL